MAASPINSYLYLTRSPRNIAQIMYDSVIANDNLVGVFQLILVYQTKLADKFDYSRVKLDPLEIRLYYDALNILASTILIYNAGIASNLPIGAGWWTHTADYLTADQLTLINNIIVLDSILSR